MQRVGRDHLEDGGFLLLGGSQMGAAFGHRCGTVSPCWWETGYGLRLVFGMPAAECRWPVVVLRPGILAECVAMLFVINTVREHQHANQLGSMDMECVAMRL